MSASGVAAAVAAVIGVGGVGYALDVPVMVSESAAVTSTGAPKVPAGTGGVKAAAVMGRSYVVVVTGSKAPPARAFGNAAVANRPAATQTAPVAFCAAGERQRDVETALSSLPEYDSVVVDGKQSPTNCAVIRRFQQRFGIDPASGQADATTADVARRIAASSTPAGQKACAAARDGVTACVDLTQQTAWVVRDGKVVLGPTVVRTGFRGYATPAGVYRINKRDLREWSDPYEVWLPYWQRFVGGIGLHETTSYIHDGSLGSHGCVNLLRADAVAMWEQLSLGATVRTFGRRPGT